MKNGHTATYVVRRLAGELRQGKALTYFDKVLAWDADQKIFVESYLDLDGTVRKYRRFWRGVLRELKTGIWL
jgi:hypothetical protein